MDEKALEELRQQIDMVDRQLLELLNERAACALKVAAVSYTHLTLPTKA